MRRFAWRRRADRRVGAISFEAGRLAVHLPILTPVEAMQLMRGSNRAAWRRRERGFVLLATFVLLAIVTYAIVNSAMVASYGVVAARRAEDRFAARQAATSIVRSSAPSGEGGSVWPDGPVDGWSDVVACDAEGGGIVPYVGEAPAGSVLVLRQWRVAAAPEGGRLLSVSAVVLDGGTQEPRTGTSQAVVRFSRLVR